MVTAFGLNQLGALAILAVLGVFLIVIHLGFASATALAASMIPIVIAVLQKVQTPGISIIGMTMVLQFVVSYGFILPVNSPQGMVAYGTDTFTARDFVRTGLVLTRAGVSADPGVRRDVLAVAGAGVRSVQNCRCEELSVRGAHKRSLRRTVSTRSAQTVCHCEERSDEAISVTGAHEWSSDSLTEIASSLRFSQ